ncbi:MAG: hypothetical protein Q8N36_02205, partial [bacterium]|nr:hypothetical protein [bacterium]
MAIIILEGIVATGKTVLSRGIEAHAEWQQYPTRTVISEHYTERVLELTSPTMEDRLALLELHLSSASQLHRLWGTYRFSGNMKTQPQFIYDRFHVTHAAQIGIIEPFLALEEQLQELDTTLVLLVHPPEELAIRILATRHERGLMWKRWLAS